MKVAAIESLSALSRLAVDEVPACAAASARWILLCSLPFLVAPTQRLPCLPLYFFTQAMQLCPPGPLVP